jgi:hypothetical protein
MEADSDYQLALAVNREIRAEEEEASFRLVQVCPGLSRSA